MEANCKSIQENLKDQIGDLVKIQTDATADFAFAAQTKRENQLAAGEKQVQFDQLTNELAHEMSTCRTNQENLYSDEYSASGLSSVPMGGDPAMQRHMWHRHDAAESHNRTTAAGWCCLPTASGGDRVRDPYGLPGTMQTWDMERMERVQLRLRRRGQGKEPCDRAAPCQWRRSMRHNESERAVQPAGLQCTVRPQAVDELE